MINRLDSQYKYPISINGHVNFDFTIENHSNWGSQTLYHISLSPSALTQILPYNNSIDRFVFGLGIRTSLTKDFIEDKTWQEQYTWIGLYPLARVYAPIGTFLELSAGPNFFILKRKKKGPSDLVGIPYGRTLVWIFSFGLGQEFRLSNSISFEPIIAYDFSQHSKTYNIPNIGTGELVSGWKFLFGFQFKIYKPK